MYLLKGGINRGREGGRGRERERERKREREREREERRGEERREGGDRRSLVEHGNKNAGYALLHILPPDFN